MKLKLTLLALLAPVALAFSGCGKKVVTTTAAPTTVSTAVVLKTVPVEAPVDIKSLGVALQSINTNVLAVTDLRKENAELRDEVATLKGINADLKAESEYTVTDIIIQGGAWTVVALAGVFFLVTLAIKSFPKWISGVAFGLSLFGLGLAYLATAALQHWFILPFVMVAAGIAGVAYWQLRKHGVQLSFLDKAFAEIVEGGEVFKASITEAAKDGKVTVDEVLTAFKTAHQKSQSTDVQSAIKEATK